MLLNKITSLFNPERFQGWGKNKKYFEGWYYKIVSKDESHAFAIIPGIAMDKKGNKHAFIQLLDGKNLKAEYYKFPVQEFKPKAKKFEVWLKTNYFSNNHIKVNLPNFSGELFFENLVKWPSSIVSPGIMGPFSFVPFMQCYHGIVSMNHTIKGKIKINNTQIDFTGGKGYIEKDWGSSFPSAYVWLQSNHFTKKNCSIKLSVAKIPWLTSSFVGFIAGVLIDGKIVQFTTYNRSKLLKCFIDKKCVNIIIENPSYKLEVFAKRDNSTELAGPILGLMEGRIGESMTAILKVKLFDKKQNQFILDAVGSIGGLEIAGNISEIMV